jgi:tRNA A37 threonylcarbamoyladenosine synthetase subunit TsaC/SUA5/YrdC
MEIILAQTDTTAGFLSMDAAALSRVKQRSPSKQFLKVYPSLKSFKKDKNRVPLKYKKELRRAFQTTFILKNRASRIIKDKAHLKAVKRYKWLYSTSANQSGLTFDKEFCVNKSDIIIEDKRGLHESSPSKLYKLNSVKIRRLR